MSANPTARAQYMDSGYLHLTGVAKGSEGTVVKSTMSFNVDPGYKDTARMAVEAGLALALDGAKLANRGGGVLTPAACQGEVMLRGRSRDDVWSIIYGLGVFTTNR